MAVATRPCPDTRLARTVSERARHEFWGSETTIKSVGAQSAPFQYPAMMVSEMQGALLDAVAEARGGSPVVYDPFVGSGATMLEAIRLGLPFAGSDINPLAILIARVRSGEAGLVPRQSHIERVVSRALQLRGSVQPPEDPWCTNWFRADVAQDLAAISQAIREERSAGLRRLLWVVLAEVVRRSGNFRISTPKLQRRPAFELGRDIDVLDRLLQGATSTAARVLEAAQTQTQMGFRARGNYLPGLRLMLGDVKNADPFDQREAEVVLTSPPYGDNRTTMPYGQASFLPLKWIDTCDIADALEPGLLDAIRTLDTRSLGGSNRLCREDVDGARQRSKGLDGVLEGTLSAEGWKRVASFFADMDRSLAAVLARCTPDAHLVLTLGDRTVNGVAIPTTLIVRELLEARGVHLITTVKRPLPRQKRLALKNNFASTMRMETVLIMRRGDGQT